MEGKDLNAIGKEATEEDEEIFELIKRLESSNHGKKMKKKAYRKRQYTAETREELIATYVNQRVKSISDAADAHHVLYATAKNWIEEFLASGQALSTKTRGRPKKDPLNEEEIQFIRRVLEFYSQAGTGRPNLSQVHGLFRSYFKDNCISRTRLESNIINEGLGALLKMTKDGSNEVEVEEDEPDDNMINSLEGLFFRETLVSLEGRFPERFISFGMFPIYTQGKKSARVISFNLLGSLSSKKIDLRIDMPLGIGSAQESRKMRLQINQNWEAESVSDEESDERLSDESSSEEAPSTKTVEEIGARIVREAWNIPIKDASEPTDKTSDFAPIDEYIWSTLYTHKTEDKCYIIVPSHLSDKVDNILEEMNTKWHCQYFLIRIPKELNQLNPIEGILVAFQMHYDAFDRSGKTNSQIVDILKKEVSKSAIEIALDECANEWKTIHQST